MEKHAAASGRAHERIPYAQRLFRSRRESVLTLRIALVRDGRVIDEQVLPPGQTLTIGPNEHDLVSVGAVDFPSSSQLIRASAKGYSLVLPKGATCALVPGPSSTLTETSARDTGARAGDIARSTLLGAESVGVPIRLERGARGRVRIGGLTLLFQVAPKPTTAPALPLPPELRRGLEIDWVSTVIAAFSFLFHFGIVGSIYSDWLDPLVDDQIVVGRVIESIASLPTAPPVETPHEANAKASEVASPRATTPAVGRSPSSRAPGPAPRTASMSESRAQALAREMEALDVAVAATLRAGGASTDEVLSRESAMADLDTAATENRVVRPGTDLHFGASGDGPSRSGDLRDLAHAGGGESIDGGHAAAPKHAPGGQVALTVSATPDVFPDAPAVIAGLQARFHRCYQRGLSAEDPTMRGTMRLTLKVGPNGEVAGTNATSGGSLSGTVISCVQGAAAGAHFRLAPGELGGTLVVPMSFQPQ